MKIKLLDTTLRDGGFMNDFNFSPEVVRHVITGLDKANIDYIEVGFRNGMVHAPSPGMGVQATSPKKYLDDCRKCILHAKLTVIFFAKNVQESDFKEMRDCGVDSVRICISPKNPDLERNIQAIEMAKTYGFEAFANLVFVSQSSIEALQSLVFELAKHDPHGIYLADSAGHLIPNQITQIFSFLQKQCPLDFGFHAHDNLFLAQANALAAIQSGVSYIDATLCGIGRGVGNLHTEGIVSLLRSQGVVNYHLPQIMLLAEYVHLHVQKQKSPLPLKAMISGVFNCSENDLVDLDYNAPLDEYYLAVEALVNKK